jgi:hypothetical protein
MLEPAMNRAVAIVLLTFLGLTTEAPAASAAAYRTGDVTRALVKSFKRGHGGTDAKASCKRMTRDTSWRCRIARATGERSTQFRVKIARRGAWKATKFSFPGFSARYALQGCCLKRR